MGKTLVLAEKPSVGRELARVLGCNTKKEGCLAGGRYIVTWALGHLVTLADPEDYDDKYKKWELETLPMLPPRFQLVVIRETAKQYHVVKTLLKSPEVSDLVIATDAGREGELVARWILEKAGFQKPIKRLWISSQTDKAIREGFQKLRDGREYVNLYQSAVCRAQADWVVGLNITRALTCKYNAQLSAGRVQTPTLSMIVAREKEIRAFVPKEYYTVSLKAQGFNMLWRDGRTGQNRLFDQSAAQAIAAKVSGKDGRITQVQKQLKSEPAPLLYDLTELQRDANKRYGYTAKQTLSYMQQLYETHKLLTYPRTDSRYLSADIVPTLPERLKSISVGGYAPFAREILRGSIKASKRFVDDSKVSDHHAIIPTEQFVDFSRLSFDERRIYDLVVKRFLAVLSPAFEYTQTTVTASFEGNEFTARGKIIRSKGWKAVYDGSEPEEDDEAEQDDKEQVLPEVRQGDTLRCVKAEVHTGKTKPPARYTEATLLSAMEHPGKFVTDASLRSVLDDAGGIGTPATRADIIEKLFATSYVERRGKEIFPLSKGEQLVNLVPEDLKSPLLTAKWEQQLNLIAAGRAQPNAFMNEMRDYAARLVRGVIQSDATYRHDNMTRTRCPVCGKYLLEVNGKKGKLLVCQDRECGYRQNLSFQSNARCPNCHKKLTVVGEGEKRLYTCTCGFREKFDRYNQELSERRSQSSKRDVADYMRKQQAAPKNSALAEALAKAMKDREK